MTKTQWQKSLDPQSMIRWLENQGYVEQLWGFTIASCRRFWDDLPGDAFRRVVLHFEQVGSHDVEDALFEAYQSLAKLERRYRKTDDDAELSRLSRQIGVGRIVLAFEFQDGAEAAKSVSNDLLEWASDPEAERRSQAESLRRLVPDPSPRATPTD